MKNLSQISFNSLLLCSWVVALNIMVLTGISASSMIHSLQPAPPGNGIIKDIPIDAVFYNACCDEEVHVTGTAHLLINENVMHVVVQGISGVGLTTNSVYTGVGASVETNVKYSSQNVGILTFHMNLTNDEGCAFKLKLTWQLHVNANGEVTAELMKTDVKCDD